MDDSPGNGSAMMNPSGGPWLFSHTPFNTIHDATLGPGTSQVIYHS